VKWANPETNRQFFTMTCGFSDSYRPALSSSCQPNDSAQELFEEVSTDRSIFQPIHHEPTLVWKFVTQGPVEASPESPRMLSSLGAWIVASIVLMHAPGRSNGNSERKALSFHLVRIQTHRLFRSRDSAVYALDMATGF
jgi:hypothetical protein